MELLVPFMLFFLTIPDNGEGMPVLERYPAMYESYDHCMAVGRELLTARDLSVGQQSAQRKADQHETGSTVHIFCNEVPAGEEFETMFDRMEARRNAAQ